jgi:hypothetical protein
MLLLACMHGSDGADEDMDVAAAPPQLMSEQGWVDFAPEASSLSACMERFGKTIGREGKLWIPDLESRGTRVEAVMTKG